MSTPVETDERYLDVVEKLGRHQLSPFDIGQLLEQVTTERLFGPCECFADFMAYHLDDSERHGYRLIFAYRMREEIIRAGVKTLPTAESQVRPLSRLGGQETPDTTFPTAVALQIACWEKACLVKREGHAPRAIDVTREVNRVLIPKPDEKTNRDLRAYRSAINRCKQWVVRANRILEGGSLDSFFLLSESGGKAGKRAKRKRQFILYQLRQIEKILGSQIEAFESAKPHSPNAEQSQTRPSSRLTPTTTRTKPTAFIGSLPGTGQPRPPVPPRRDPPAPLPVPSGLPP